MRHGGFLVTPNMSHRILRGCSALLTLAAAGYVLGAEQSVIAPGAKLSGNSITRLPLIASMQVDSTSSSAASGDSSR